MYTGLIISCIIVIIILTCFIIGLICLTVVVLLKNRKQPKSKKIEEQNAESTDSLMPCLPQDEFDEILSNHNIQEAFIINKVLSEFIDKHKDEIKISPTRKDELLGKEEKEHLEQVEESLKRALEEYENKYFCKSDQTKT